MKPIIYTLAIICTFILSSCDNRADIQGQWYTDDIQLDLPNSIASKATLVLTFSQDGKMSVNADIDITQWDKTCYQTSGIDSTEVNYRVVAEIDGSWQYVKGKNDEVVLKMNDDSYTLTVDPASVTSLPIPLDQEALDALREQVISKASSTLTSQIRAYFARFTRINDIKVNKESSPYLIFDAEGLSEDEQEYTLKMI